MGGYNGRIYLDNIIRYKRTKNMGGYNGTWLYSTLGEKNTQWVVFCPRVWPLPDSIRKCYGAPLGLQSRKTSEQESYGWEPIKSKMNQRINIFSFFWERESTSTTWQSGGNHMEVCKYIKWYDFTCVFQAIIQYPIPF